MTKVVRIPPPGVAFTFRWYPKWQFWRRRTGVGRVVATDEHIGVAHVAILGFDRSDEGPSYIQHTVIIGSRLAEAVLSEHESHEFEQQDVWPQVQAWRSAYAADQAGAFAVPLGEAIDMIIETVGEAGAAAVVETAYPVKDSFGELRKVRAVVLP